MRLVFLVPVFNERETLEALADGIARHTPQPDYRVLFVDDGSTDGSYEVMRALHQRDSRIGVLKLRGNHGKTRALAAGIARAEGDVLLTMDADLQDDPREIPKLLAKLEEGYDMVCGWKADRRDPWHKVIPSRVYNAVVGRLFGLPLRDLNSGFKAMRMELAKRLPLYGDMHRMMVVFAANMGGKIAEVPVLHHPRRYGRSKYGFRRFYEGIRDALAVWVITRLSRETEHLLERACMAAAVVAFTLAPFLLRGGSILSASLLVALALCAIFAWRIFHVAGQSLDAAHADPTRFIEHELM